MKRFLILIPALLFSVAVLAKEEAIPYTHADRDRLVRVEAKVDALEKRMDKKYDKVDKAFDKVDKKFDRLEDKFENYFMWGFGLVLMSIFVLIGFIIYDRRTTLAPVENKTEQIS